MQDFSGKRVESSQKSTVIHFVSVFFPVMVAQGVLFSMLIYYNEHIMRLGLP